MPGVAASGWGQVVRHEAWEPAVGRRLSGVGSPVPRVAASGWGQVVRHEAWEPAVGRRLSGVGPDAGSCGVGMGSGRAS